MCESGIEKFQNIKNNNMDLVKSYVAKSNRKSIKKQSNISIRVLYLYTE